MLLQQASRHQRVPSVLRLYSIVHFNCILQKPGMGCRCVASRWHHTIHRIDPANLFSRKKEGKRTDSRLSILTNTSLGSDQNKTRCVSFHKSTVCREISQINRKYAMCLRITDENERSTFHFTERKTSVGKVSQVVSPALHIPARCLRPESPFVPRNTLALPGRR